MGGKNLNYELLMCPVSKKRLDCIVMRSKIFLGCCIAHTKGEDAFKFTDPNHIFTQCNIQYLYILLLQIIITVIILCENLADSLGTNIPCCLFRFTYSFQNSEHC